MKSKTMKLTRRIRLRASNTLLVLSFVLILCVLRVFNSGPLYHSAPSQTVATFPLEVSAFPERAVIEITVISTRGSWTGSGVIVGRNEQTYYVLTCFHVTDNADLLIQISKTWHAKVIANAPQHDLSLIEFSSPDDLVTVPYTIGRLKEWTMIVGWRMGIQRLHIGNITANFPGGRIGVSGGVLPGYSGGGVFNRNGHLIGVVSALEVARGSLMMCSGVIIGGPAIKEFLDASLPR